MKNLKEINSLLIAEKEIKVELFKKSYKKSNIDNIVNNLYQKKV